MNDNIKEAFIGTLVCKFVREWMEDDTASTTLTVETIYDKVKHYPYNPFKHYPQTFPIVAKTFKIIGSTKKIQGKYLCQNMNRIIKGTIKVTQDKAI